MTEETDWKTSSEAWQKRCHEMHRRAQKAEGELARMKQAHADAYRASIADGEGYVDYHAYGFVLLNGNKKLFPCPVEIVEKPDGSIDP